MSLAMNDLGRMLIIMGVILILAGLLLVLGNRIPLLGRLPGDIHIQRTKFTFHFPIVTCLLISLVLTVFLNLILRLFRK